ncbi:hypothetical protein [Polynucleobacter alcilacus]|uniref:hypothetical protein n=1 Tax=Polynucleobacter alcilacus TaxID=1819739 RepID=UPI001C0E66F9|nr:hypothetical protein [Polynucleobacter alcilacus]MBU3568166.1 hypothetical protein [Polynucleobacter alcilacus]
MKTRDFNYDENLDMSILSIFFFVRGAWKEILLFGVAGLVLSIIFITKAPKKFEAGGQIFMAQLMPMDVINPKAMNVEEPSALIWRLSHPNSFTPQVSAACGLQDQPNAGQLLGQSSHFTLPKGVTNALEFKVLRPTPELAKECGLAIFEFIKATQSALVAPVTDEAESRLAFEEGRLQKSKEFVLRVEKMGNQAMSAAYIFEYNEMRQSIGEIRLLKNMINFNQNHVTRLLFPINSSDTPIGPQKSLILATGIIGGVFLGLIIAFIKKLFLRNRSQSNGSRCT